MAKKKKSLPNEIPGAAALREAVRVELDKIIAKMGRRTMLGVHAEEIAQRIELFKLPDAQFQGLASVKTRKSLHTISRAYRRLAEEKKSLNVSVRGVLDEMLSRWFAKRNVSFFLAEDDAIADAVDSTIPLLGRNRKADLRAIWLADALVAAYRDLANKNPTSSRSSSGKINFEIFVESMLEAIGVNSVSVETIVEIATRPEHYLERRRPGAQPIYRPKRKP